MLGSSLTYPPSTRCKSRSPLRSHANHEITRMSPFLWLEPRPCILEKIMFNPSQLKAFSHSVCLKTTITACTCNCTPDDANASQNLILLFTRPVSQRFEREARVTWKDVKQKIEFTERECGSFGRIASGKIREKYFFQVETLRNGAYAAIKKKQRGTRVSINLDNSKMRRRADRWRTNKMNRCERVIPSQTGLGKALPVESRRVRRILRVGVGALVNINTVGRNCMSSVEARRR